MNRIIDTPGPRAPDRAGAVRRRALVGRARRGGLQRRRARLLRRPAPRPGRARGDDRRAAREHRPRLQREPVGVHARRAGGTSTTAGTRRSRGCGRSTTSWASSRRSGRPSRRTRSRSWWRWCSPTRPPVLSFVYGIPGLDVLEACREAGIVTIGTAITVEEAVALDTAGVDAIVVSGFEAGGHRVAFLRAAEDSLVGHARAGPGGGRRGARAGDRGGRDRGPARRASPRSRSAPRRCRSGRRSWPRASRAPSAEHRQRARRRPAPHAAHARDHRPARARARDADHDARTPSPRSPYQAMLSLPADLVRRPGLPRLLGRPGRAARARRPRRGGVAARARRGGLERGARVGSAVPCLFCSPWRCSRCSPRPPPRPARGRRAAGRCACRSTTRARRPGRCRSPTRSCPRPGRGPGTIVFLTGGPGEPAVRYAPEVATRARRGAGDARHRARRPARDRRLRRHALRHLRVPRRLREAARGEAAVPDDRRDRARHRGRCARRWGSSASRCSASPTGRKVAGEYARRFPERTAGLILDSPVGLGRDRGRRAGRDRRDAARAARGLRGRALRAAPSTDAAAALNAAVRRVRRERRCAGRRSSAARAGGRPSTRSASASCASTTRSSSPPRSAPIRAGAARGAAVAGAR